VTTSTLTCQDDGLARFEFHTPLPLDVDCL